jgi:CcmD family protein
VSDVGWLFVAFAVVWVAIGGYLLSLQVRQKELERRVEQLHKRTS